MKRKETLGPHPPSKRKRRFVKDQNKENVMNKTLKPSQPIPEIEEARKSRLGLSFHLLISKPVSENMLKKSIEKSIEQLQLSPSAKTEINIRIIIVIRKSYVMRQKRSPIRKL